MESPLAFLFRFFFRRFFDPGSSAADARITPRAAFALLFVPGCVLSILLMLKYSSLARAAKRQWAWNVYVESLSDKYVFIVYCVVITALIALLRWDSLFPDRRDHANLAPLPVGLRTILAAKVLALCAFVFSFVSVVNAGSTVLFPSVALEDSGSPRDLLVFIFAHAVTMLLAGLWAFSTVLAMTGLMMALLPYGLLRRAKRYAQFLVVIALIGLVLTTPAAITQTEALRTGDPSWAAWLPPMWFLGLYEVLGQHASGSFPGLSARALVLTAGAILIAVLAYALSYRLFFLKSAEAVPAPSAVFRVPESAFRILEATVLRKAYDAACFRFIVKTLARSDRHSAVFAGMLGLGLTVAALNLIASGGWTTPIPVGALKANLVGIYTVVTALRVSFGIPVDTESNWIFRLTAGPDVEPHGISQRTLACFVAPLVIVPAAGFALLYDTRAALIHLLYASLCAAVLIQALTLDFRVLPFTCSWLPGRKNPVVAAAAWFGGLVTFGQTLGAFEYFVFDKPVGMAILLLAALVVAGILYRVQQSSDAVAWTDTRGELELLRIGD